MPHCHALRSLPIAHKDLFCTQGVRTSCASKMLDNFKAPYDANLALHGVNVVTLARTAQGLDLHNLEALLIHPCLKVLRPLSQPAAATTRFVQALEISHFVRQVAFHLVKLPRNSRSLVPVHFGA